jgi:hypothetical protein
LQATQPPLQATLQQTPSTQKPDPHCEPTWQVMPSGRRALQALPLQQIPPVQVPAWHWMSQAHASLGFFRIAGGTVGQWAGSTPSTKPVLRSPFGAPGDQGS